ncbi:MAG: hypothetical protein ACN2B6_07810 [Rickettsiales bacterium]
MTIQLTDAQRKQFGELFVTVDPDITDEAERARLHERGVELYTQQFDIVELIAASVGGEVPKLEVHTDTNKLGGEPAELYEGHDKSPVIRAAINTPKATENVRALLAEYSAKLDDRILAEEQPQVVDRKPDEDGNTGYGLHSSRARYDLETGPDHSKACKNTVGDIYHYRHMREHNPEQWNFWLDILFTHALKQPQHDWLRSLRVHAGRTRGEIADLLGISEQTYVHVEKKKSYKDQLSLSSCQKILQKNIFQWPIGKDGFVEDTYANTFLTKLGHDIRQFDWRTGKLKEDWADIALREYPDDHKAQAGKVLEEFRMRSCLFQAECAEKIGVAQPTLSDWEHGAYAIDYKKLPLITTTLGLSEQEQVQFTQLILPALNANWLDKQDEGKQAGLLLTALRKSRGIAPSSMANKLSITQGGYSFLETTPAAIPCSRLNDITMALGLSDEESKNLLHRRLPALNPEWLATQDEDKRAGLLLRALRNHANLTQKECGKKIQTQPITIGAWENAKRKIGSQYVPSLMALAEDHKDKTGVSGEYFKEIIEKSNTAISERHAIARAEAKLGAVHRAADHPELVEGKEQNKGAER